MLNRLTEKLKIHGIKQRWLLNNVLFSSFIVVVGVAAFSVAVARYYYSSVQGGLETKANASTSFFENYITRTYAEYYESAYEFTQSFEDSGVIELQFINPGGRIMVSSYSMTGGTASDGPDIRTALSTRLTSTWSGKNSKTGERVLAVSAPMTHADGTVIGVMRYVTSLRNVDRVVMMNIAAAAGIGIALIALMIVTNATFIRSVVEPIRDITGIAQRISGGSYGIRIGNKYKDEIGEMVDSINEMSVKIAQAEKAQTEFISSVSHELRTPLTAITGWSETILYDENLDEDSRRGVNIIFIEAKRLTNMVEELLEFTRIQDGRFTLNIQKIDIEAELEESVITYAELLKREGIELEYIPYGGELPLINGDPERLKQVFLNILDNAAKYGREGKRIIVSLDRAGDYINISIRDFGPGIPPDEIEFVKMKFYKGSSKQRGSGIGLAVCEEIVSYHNGILELKNAQDGGLIVTIKLPVNE